MANLLIAISTITRANENRSFQIYEDLAMLLIKEAQQLYVRNDDLEVHLRGNVFAVDATTIDLCLSTFFKEQEDNQLKMFDL